MNFTITLSLSLLGLTMIDSPSTIREEVTVPFIATALGDATMDVTSAALLSEDDPGIRATQVKDKLYHG